MDFVPGLGAYLYFGVTAATRSATLCSTVRDLPNNHLLAPADLTCTSAGAATLFSGLYLRGNLTKGSHLTPESVGDRPLLSVSPDGTTFTLDIPADAASSVDAGQKLDLGTPSAVLAKQAAVIAVLCGSRGSGKCTLALEVPQSALKPLVDAAGAVGIVDSSKIAPAPVSGGTPADSKTTPKKQETPRDAKKGGNQ